MSGLSTDDILLGLGLVVVLAIGSQLLARRLGIPAIVVLLPLGFIAGIATEDVQPDKLLGALYQPFVSLAVGVILFEAGLRLTFREVAVGVHKVLVRLLAAGVVVTWVGVAITVALLFDDMDRGVPWLIGAILVVSGPTVVLPLLAFIRPARTVRSLLKWEGTLVDPIGALLGVVVFHCVQSEWQAGEFLIDIGVGALVGLVGAFVLRLLLHELHLNAPRQAVPATLMVVVGSLVAADLLRQDAGFVATVLMGVALANQGRFDVSLTLEFQETLVQLLVGASSSYSSPRQSPLPTSKGSCPKRSRSSSSWSSSSGRSQWRSRQCAPHSRCVSARSWPGWRRAGSWQGRLRRRSACSWPRKG
jgi:NhaP-type Na+/H+ or K+/H+ antiporter